LSISFIARLRRWIVTGLLVWFPLGATILVFSLLLDITNRVLFLLPARYRPEELLGFNIPGLGLFLSFIVVLATGMLSANLIGRKLVSVYESILNRIPLVRSVYGSLKHFAEVVFSDSGTSFKKVLLIEYPRKGLYSLCFQTSEDAREVQSKTGEEIVTVFLPTTPNPTSGFYLVVPEDEIREVDLTVEDAFKLVMSAGLVTPEMVARARPRKSAAVSPEPATESR
jgi:uncharacterized membrane protein